MSTTTHILVTAHIWTPVYEVLQRALSGDFFFFSRSIWNELVQPESVVFLTALLSSPWVKVGEVSARKRVRRKIKEGNGDKNKTSSQECFSTNDSCRVTHTSLQPPSPPPPPTRAPHPPCWFLLKYSTCGDIWVTTVLMDPTGHRENTDIRSLESMTNNIFLSFGQFLLIFQIFFIARYCPLVGGHFLNRFL